MSSLQQHTFLVTLVLNIWFRIGTLKTLTVLVKEYMRTKDDYSDFYLYSFGKFQNNL